MDRARECAVVDIGKEQDVCGVDVQVFERLYAFRDGVMQDQAEEQCGKALSLKEAIYDLQNR